MTSRFIAFLIAARWPLLVAAIVLAALAWWPASQVRFDHSIERMFAPNDPLLPPYERLKSRFGANEVVLAVYRDPDLLNPDGSGIARLAEVSGQLKKVAGVRDVLSLAQVNDLLAKLQTGKSLFNLFGGKPKDAWTGPPILDPKSPLAERYRDLFAGYTHSADGQTAAIACLLEPMAAEPNQAKSGRDPRAATIDSLQQVMRSLPGGLSPGVLAGEPVMVAQGFELLEQDGRSLGIWSTILLGLTILICFRSLRWLLLPILVVQWSILLTRALLVVSGLQLSMVSSMLTAIITVVGVATVMHLIVRYRELRAAGVPPHAALQQAAVQLAWPIIGALATDVAGFGSLWWAQVAPVQDFGTMMVVGSIVVLPAILLFTPGISLIGMRDGDQARPGWGEQSLGRWLARLVEGIQKHSIAVAVFTTVITLLAAAGAYRLQVETDFTRNFRPGSPVVAAYEFVETRLGGAGVWDVVVPAPAVLDAEYLAKVRDLQAKLRALSIGGEKFDPPRPALTKVISLIDALDAAEADPTVAALAPSAELRAQMMAGFMPSFLATLRSTEPDEHGQGRLRIMLRAHERQPAEQKQRLIADVTRLAREAFPPSDDSAGAEVTGFFVLLTNLIESMLRDQWTTFGVATVGVFALLLVSLRSLKLSLIALVPNAAPIFVVMGLLGWLGLAINMGAAMIAAVSMGLSVDSSIHYLVAYRRERRAGKTVAAALAAVQQSVGRAMIFSTFALIVGFAVLITSQFVPTIYFGALVSLAMLGGLAGNLVVLPLLLSWVERDEPEKGSRIMGAGQ
ncbi:MAG: MMPL family transporter [Pirellulaceae bacterium]|nr:MMPL family transporter [Pirellulaceae bacterium]